MANEDDERRPQERASDAPKREPRAAETGKAKGYSRPSRDTGGRPPRSNTSRPLNSSPERGERPAAGRDSATRAPSGYQGRPDRGGSDRGAPRASRDGDARGYQGRPDRGGPARDGAQRGGPRRDSDPRAQGGFRGKGGPAREDDSRVPRNEGLVRKAPVAPDIPEEVTFDLLDKVARGSLRTLSKDNAEDVGRHLVMAGRLIDIDPELAYQHAQVAVARGGRVDIVREAAALTAYASGRYADALREFRTVRRLNGSNEHLALMADCERGLGRPERAIALAHESDSAKLDPATVVELQIVIAGARMDMGDSEAALVTLGRINTKDKDAKVRVSIAKVGVLRSLGRGEEADTLEAQLPVEDEDEPTWADEVYLYDTEELPEPVEEVAPAEELDDVVDGEDRVDKTEGEENE